MANVWLGNGRLTRDPEIRHTAEGGCIARWVLAVKRNMSRDDDNTPDADFISCVAFGKTAEFVEKHLFKGKAVFVNGRLQTGSYIDRDGKTVYTTDVVANHVEFAESKVSEDAALGRTGTPVQTSMVKAQVQVQPQQVVKPTTVQSQAKVAVSGTVTNDGFMTIPEGIVDNLPWSQ